MNPRAGLNFMVNIKINYP